jgi:hypothetical protein
MTIEEQQVFDDLRRERDKLQRFKDYVHKRLDDAGVPVDPDSTHKAEGCRIGGRLDCVISERDELRAECNQLRVILGSIYSGTYVKMQSRASAALAAQQPEARK